MILQNDGLAGTQMLCYPPPFFSIYDYSTKLWIDCVVTPEPEAVLGDHVKLATKDRKGLAIHAVGVAGCVDIWTGLVDCRVNSKGCGIDRLVTLDNEAFFIHQDQV